MANHDDSQLWRYLDGEMAPADAEALERDRAADPELDARLDDLQLLSDAVLDDAPTPPAGFGTRVAAAARLQGVSPQSAEVLDLQRFLRRALIAAALLAALGLGYLAFEVVPDLMQPPLQAGSDPLLEPR